MKIMMAKSPTENFCEFLIFLNINPNYIRLIFRYAKTGKLQSPGLRSLASSCSVEDVGVGGAKNFFEQKAAELNDNVAERDRAYREQRKKEMEAKRQNKAAFREKAAMFQ